MDKNRSNYWQLLILKIAFACKVNKPLEYHILDDIRLSLVK